MRKKIFICAILSLIGIAFYIGRVFIYDKEIAGQYFYINNSESADYLNIPRQNDNLLLSKQSKFKSQFWGTGKYEVQRTLTATKINLFYDDEFGEGQCVLKVSKNLFDGNIRLIMSTDLNKYYLKK